MTRFKSAAFLILLLAACGKQTVVEQSTPPQVSIERQISNSCVISGYNLGTIEHTKCYIDELTRYQQTIMKRKSEQRLAYEREQREIAKQEKMAIVSQQKQDKNKCKSYGLRYGTDSFAACLMGLEQDRKNQMNYQATLQQQQLIFQQQQMAAERAEAARKQNLDNCQTVAYLAGGLSSFAVSKPLEVTTEALNNCENRYGRK